jgi:hypothetical protein
MSRGNQREVDRARNQAKLDAAAKAKGKVGTVQSSLPPPVYSIHSFMYHDPSGEY